MEKSTLGVGNKELITSIIVRPDLAAHLGIEQPSWWNSTSWNGRIKRDSYLMAGIDTDVSLTDDSEMAPRWTRYLYIHDEGYPDSFPEYQVPQYFFTFQSVSGVNFWYPIPLGELGSEPFFREPSPLLTCRTQRDWLCLAENFKQNRYSCFFLRSTIGIWASMVHLQSSDDLQFEPG